MRVYLQNDGNIDWSTVSNFKLIILWGKQKKSVNINIYWERNKASGPMAMQLFIEHIIINHAKVFLFCKWLPFFIVMCTSYSLRTLWHVLLTSCVCVDREELDIAQQQYIESLEKYENNHLGNFRRIYPGPGTEKYEKFFHSSGTLFQETAAFKARSELAR